MYLTVSLNERLIQKNMINRWVNRKRVHFRLDPFLGHLERVPQVRLLPELRLLRRLVPQLSQQQNL